MMNRTEWRAVRNALIAYDQAHIGELPTVDELFAYERGELSEEAAARVRQLLVANPDLARAYAATFPAEGTDMQSTPTELAENWAGIWRKLYKSEHARRRLLSVAAAVVIGLLLCATVIIDGLLRHAHTSPQIVASSQLVIPCCKRGPRDGPYYDVTPLRFDGPNVLLELYRVSDFDARFNTFHVEIAKETSKGEGDVVLWSADFTKPPEDDDTFKVLMQRPFLEPGAIYHISIDGVAGGKRVRRYDYYVDVPRKFRSNRTPS